MRVAQKLKVIDSARNVFFYRIWQNNLQRAKEGGGRGGQRGISGPGLIKWKFFPNTP